MTTTSEQKSFSTTMATQKGALATIGRLGGATGDTYTHKIQLQRIKKYYSDGSQMHGCIKSRWQTFEDYQNDEASNLIDALLVADTRLEQERQGFIVVRRTYKNGIPQRHPDKLYDAKWGTDGLPFRRLSPLGEKMLGILAP